MDIAFNAGPAFWYYKKLLNTDEDSFWEFRKKIAENLFWVLL